MEDIILMVHNLWSEFRRNLFQKMEFKTQIIQCRILQYLFEFTTLTVEGKQANEKKKKTKKDLFWSSQF